MHLPRDTAKGDRTAAAFAAALLFAASVVPAGAADPAASAAARAGHAPAKHPAPTQIRTAPAQPVIPPAALPEALSASPQPRGPLSLETKLLPLGGETAAPAPGGAPPAPDKTKL